MTMLDAPVFGIGLSKTGTLSLCHACRVLGLTPTRHRWERMLEHFRSTGEWRTFGTAAHFDGGAWCVDAMLDAYPDAYLIHSIRPLESWLESCERWFTRDVPAYHTGRIEQFGMYRFERRRFTRVWEEHRQYVARLVERRAPRRLLTVDVTAGGGWRPLCDFLGVDEPSVPFPHSNRAARRRGK